MSDHKYTRRGQRITQHWSLYDDGEEVYRVYEDEHTDHGSLNQAKRKSREIQMAEDGALGRGCVRVT